jgi:hypothetical protein
MNKVEEYKFGSIKIAGRYYTSDIIVTREKLYPNWWRREGHSLYLDDLKDVLERDIRVLVVGSGFYGQMKPDSKLQEQLSKRGVKLIVMPTKLAVNKYNTLIEKGEKVAGAFHLTC